MKYLQPCHLRAIGYQVDPPFVLFSDYCWNLTCPNPGNAVDYFNIVLQLMNCTGEVVQIDVSSDDVFDYILNGTADVSILPLRQTIPRMAKAYFTTPVSYMYYGYIIKEIPQLEVEDYIFSSFAPEVLILLGVAAIVVGTLIYLIMVVMKESNGNLLDWTFTASQALFGQFNCKVNGPLAAQILIGFWLFFCLTIDHNFQAKLKSFLTLSHSRGTYFTTMDGMIDAVLHDGWTLVLQKRGFFPYDYCTEEQCARLRQIPSNRIIIVNTDDEMEEQINKNKHVFFTATTFDIVPNPINYMNFKKHILFVKDSEAIPEFLAYVVAKNFTGLLESFNSAVATSSSAFATIRTRYQETYPPYLTSANGNVRGEITVLKLQHVITLFRFCGELLLGAGALFLAETVFFRYIRKILSSIKKKLPSRFAHILHINQGRTTSGFHRSHTVVLPPRRSFNPVNRSFAKFYTY